MLINDRPIIDNNVSYVLIYVILISLINIRPILLLENQDAEDF